MRKENDFIEGLTAKQTDKVSRAILNIRNMASDLFDEMFQAEKDEIELEDFKASIKQLRVQFDKLQKTMERV